MEPYESYIQCSFNYFEQCISTEIHKNTKMLIVPHNHRQHFDSLMSRGASS